MFEPGKDIRFRDLLDVCYEQNPLNGFNGRNGIIMRYASIARKDDSFLKYTFSEHNRKIDNKKINL